MPTPSTVSIACPQHGAQDIAVEPTGSNQWQVTLPNGTTLPVTLTAPAGPDGKATFTVGNVQFATQAALTNDAIHLWLNGRLLVLPRPKQGPQRAGSSAAAGASGNAIVASMPGKIISVHAKAGQAVTAGEVLVVMESMKMELSLAAPCAGTVDAVNATEGNTVDQGAVLVSINADEAS